MKLLGSQDPEVIGDEDLLRSVIVRREAMEGTPAASPPLAATFVDNVNDIAYLSLKL